MEDTATPRVVMIVQNDVSGDTRVKKAALSAAAAGCAVTVVGASRTGARWESRLGPVRIVRVAAPLLISGRPSRKAAPSRLLGYRSRQTFLYASQRRELRRQQGASRRDRQRRGIAARRHAGAPFDEFAATLLRLRLQAGIAWGKVREKVYLLRRGLYRGRRLPWSSLLPIPLPWRDARTLEYLKDFEVAFGRELDALEPDLIHAHDFFTLAIAEHAVARARAMGRTVRWVYDAHEYVRGLDFFPADRYRASLALERRYVRDADRVVTVSEPLARRLQRDYHLPRPPAVVLNAPPLQAYDPSYQPTLRTLLDLGPDVPLLVYSGQVKPPRGIDTLLEALPLLPGAHLALVTNNTGSYVESLPGRSAALGCGDRLHFLPYVDSDKVSSFVRDADVGVIPLTHYGNAEVSLPTKLFEFMHARLPVVVSDTEAMRELTSSLCVGEVFTAGDARALADAVRAVLAEPERYTAPYRRRPQLLEPYSWERQERVLLEVYRELLGQRVGEPVATPTTLAETPAPDADLPTPPLEEVGGADDPPDAVAAERLQDGIRSGPAED